MYKITREKLRRGNMRAKSPKKFPKKRIKALYFTDWGSACSYCAAAGLRLKQISLM